MGVATIPLPLYLPSLLALQRMLEESAPAQLAARHIQKLLREPLPVVHLHLLLGCGNHGNSSSLPPCTTGGRERSSFSQRAHASFYNPAGDGKTSPFGLPCPLTAAPWSQAPRVPMHLVVPCHLWSHPPHGPMLLCGPIYQVPSCPVVPCSIETGLIHSSSPSPVSLQWKTCRVLVQG